jgi:hypothetical protein
MASSLRLSGAAVLIIVPLALLAAGCGGSGTPATTAAGAAAAPAAGAQSAALTAFTTCLKAHGISTTGFGRRPRGASGAFGASGERPRFDGSGPRGGFFGRNLTTGQQKAFTACRSKLPAGAGAGRFGPGGGGARNPAFAKYTQCLSKHGVKFGSSSSAAVFKKASAACAKLRPAAGGAPTSTNSTTG